MFGLQRFIRFSTVLLIVLAVCGGAGSAAAKSVERILYVNLLGGLEPWSVEIFRDGKVVWDNSSQGQLLMEPAKERKEGTVPAERCQALAVLLEKYGYTVKRPVEGVEPKIRLTVFFDDGTNVTNLGPSPMADDDVLRDFTEVEKLILELTVSTGASARGFYYKP